jgi:hypothetical protein
MEEIEGGRQRRADGREKEAVANWRMNDLWLNEEEIRGAKMQKTRGQSCLTRTSHALGDGLGHAGHHTLAKNS